MLFVLAVAALLQIAPEWKAPSWVTVIGIALTWAVGAVAVLRYRADIKRERRELADEQAAMVVRLCREYMTSTAFVSEAEKRLHALIAAQIDEAFRLRAPSFASAERAEALGELIDRVDRSVARVVEFLASNVSLREGIKGR